MQKLAIDKSHSVITNAVVVKEGQVLISQRGTTEAHDPGKWTIPGGKVEQTEGNVWNILETTVAKEVREETGVQIGDSPRMIADNTFIRSSGQHVLVLIFLCRWKSGEATPLEDRSGVAWVKEKDLGKYDFSPNVERYILMSFAGADNR